MKRILLVLALFEVAVPFFAADTDVPRKAPELQFKVPGEGDRLLSQYRGKVVALEFIMTTCPHCQAASKVMTQFQVQYGSRGFQAIDVAINGLDDGRNGTQADQLVEMFSRNFQVGFPVGWIPKDQFFGFMGFSVMERFVVPELVMIDRKGYIQYQTPRQGDESSMRQSALQQRIEQLLVQGNSESSAKSRPVTKKGL